MVTSPYRSLSEKFLMEILERDVKPQIINQSILSFFVSKKLKLDTIYDALYIPTKGGDCCT
jgi:hypothetical protein